MAKFLGAILRFLLQIELDSPNFWPVFFFIKSIVLIWVTLQFYVSRISWELIFIIYYSKKTKRATKGGKKNVVDIIGANLVHFAKVFMLMTDLRRKILLREVVGTPTTNIRNHFSLLMYLFFPLYVITQSFSIHKMYF